MEAFEDPGVARRVRGEQERNMGAPCSPLIEMVPASAVDLARAETEAACAGDVARIFGLVDGITSWPLIKAWAEANAPFLAMAQERGTIAGLQASLPWGNTYTEDVQQNRQPHRDFTHALLHIVKASGHLAGLVDALDHGDDLRDAYRRYLADVVISAIRAANTFPGGKVDLALEIDARLSRNAAQKGRGAP
jgi:hypothetical protein